MSTKEIFNKKQEELEKVLSGMKSDDILCLLLANIVGELVNIEEKQKMFFIGKMNYSVCKTLIMNENEAYSGKKGFSCQM